MTDMMSGVPNSEDADETKPAAGLDGLDEQLVDQLVSRAKAGGLQLTGEGGVLQQPVVPRQQVGQPVVIVHGGDALPGVEQGDGFVDTALASRDRGNQADCRVRVEAAAAPGAVASVLGRLSANPGHGRRAHQRTWSCTGNNAVSPIGSKESTGVGTGVGRFVRGSSIRQTGRLGSSMLRGVSPVIHPRMGIVVVRKWGQFVHEGDDDHQALLRLLGNRESRDGQANAKGGWTPKPVSQVPEPPGAPLRDTATEDDSSPDQGE